MNLPMFIIDAFAERPFTALLLAKRTEGRA